MARPKVLKLDDGEIILRNIPKDKQDKLVDILTGVVPIHNLQQTAPQEEETAESDPFDDSLDQIAVSLVKNSVGHWNIVKVKYNLETKKAQVDEIRDLKDERAIAASDFRVLVMKNFPI